MLLEQGDAVAEQVHGGLEAGREHQPGRGLELGVVEPDPFLLHPHQLAHQVVARLAPEVREVRVEPRLELPQPALHPPELAEPQPQVEARRRGVAELQHPAAVLGRYAEDLRDHGHRQLAQYAETRSTGLVGSSESSSSSAICWVRARRFSTARAVKTRVTSLR